MLTISTVIIDYVNTMASGQGKPQVVDVAQCLVTRKRAENDDG
jgi:hypothetical protein